MATYFPLGYAEHLLFFDIPHSVAVETKLVGFYFSSIEVSEEPYYCEILLIGNKKINDTLVKKKITFKGYFYNNRNRKIIERGEVDV